MKPFSDNIIFWDTEFTSFNPSEGELLSVGMIKATGEELYFELEADVSKVHSWIKENVLPHLSGQKISRTEAMEKVFQFVGNSYPYMVCYVNPFDVVYLYKLMGVDQMSKFFKLTHQLDFASILFAWGIDPKTFDIEHSESLTTKFGVDISKYKSHHALDDAKKLRDVYLKLIEK